MSEIFDLSLFLQKYLKLNGFSAFNESDEQEYFFILTNGANNTKLFVYNYPENTISYLTNSFDTISNFSPNGSGQNGTCGYSFASSHNKLFSHNRTNTSYVTGSYYIPFTRSGNNNIIFSVPTGISTPTATAGVKYSSYYDRVFYLVGSGTNTTANRLKVFNPNDNSEIFFTQSFSAGAATTAIDAIQNKIAIFHGNTVNVKRFVQATFNQGVTTYNSYFTSSEAYPLSGSSQSTIKYSPNGKYVAASNLNSTTKKTHILYSTDNNLIDLMSGSSELDLNMAKIVWTSDSKCFIGHSAVSPYYHTFYNTTGENEGAEFHDLNLMGTGTATTVYPLIARDRVILVPNNSTALGWTIWQMNGINPWTLVYSSSFSTSTNVYNAEIF